MSDDLRTRIAAALRNMTGDLTYEAMADAVIEALGLRQEWLTEQSSRLGLVALTEPEHPIATRTSSSWTAQPPAQPRRLWDIFAEADQGQ